MFVNQDLYTITFETSSDSEDNKENKPRLSAKTNEPKKRKKVIMKKARSPKRKPPNQTKIVDQTKRDETASSPKKEIKSRLDPLPRESVYDLESETKSTKISKIPKRLDQRIAFTLIREKHIHVNGQRLLFFFLNDGKIMFSAKAKSINSETIPFSSNPETHLSQPNTFIGYLKMENKNTDYFFYSNIRTEQGIDLPDFCMQFSIPKEDEGTFRSTSLTFPLTSEIPPLSNFPLNTSMEYGASFLIPSIRNTILGDEILHQIYCVFSKTSKSTLNVNTFLGFDPLWCFAMGVALYVGKKPS